MAAVILLRNSMIRREGRALAEAADLDWFALTVPPQKEFLAQLLLERRGVTTFVPVERKWRHVNRFTRRRRGKVLREFPLLVRYVLVGFDGAPAWVEVFRLGIVQSVVGIDGEPYRIPFEAIERLIRLDGGGHFVAPREHRFMATRKEFKVGDQVRFARGPFADPEWTFKVEEIVGREARGHLLIFARPTPVAAPLEELEPA